nr:hypothetical protein [Pseudomonas sp. R5(2019)]
MQELGSLTTSNIQTWLDSRIQLLHSLAQQIAQEGVENLQATLRACRDLESQVNRLKHLVGTFRI